MTKITSPSRVIKIPNFKGRLSIRPLYVYLPPGYSEEQDVHYPVIYMHDGQNCFQAHVADSYAGSWRADETADHLIGRKRMRPTIIVGVSNGGENRMVEYLPPYASIRPRLGKYPLPWPNAPCGRADETLAYYREDVATAIEREFRVLPGRENRATCGSSMGGLFSTYIAWDHPQFARHHAIMSPSYWVTCNWRGVMSTVERLRLRERRDVRLWLDSGTQYEPGRGDDGMKDTATARDALLSGGYELGPDFNYYLAEGAVHHESAWAARLPQVFHFLFPTENEV
jgi:predicted alpha/beta superfamily hydrolase